MQRTPRCHFYHRNPTDSIHDPLRRFVTMKQVYEFSNSELRDPEDRAIDEQDLTQIREKMLDKTIADSFPASDPPSTNPAPAVDPFLR